MTTPIICENNKNCKIGNTADDYKIELYDDFKPQSGGLIIYRFNKQIFSLSFENFYFLFFLVTLCFLLVFFTFFSINL